jgi:hypothetical protein
MSRPRPDSWDQWVASRSGRFRGYGPRSYVSQDIPGVADLDSYGRWTEVSGYGTCWSPANVSSRWQPYRDGRWIWQDPWGWSWVSNEPWGWAPYHYGRWVTSRSRWYWVPQRPDTRRVRYAPALVAFVGGPDFSLSISVGGGRSRGDGGYVGWFPLAPRDPFVPWWGRGAHDTNATNATNVTNVTNITNVTYVNRSYVTVVNQTAFTSGAPVGANVITDARAVRDISVAPVVRGPIQVMPLVSSIRSPSGRVGSTPRPPAAALTRTVVTRLAPAPAPILFREKESLIRERSGAPVAPVVAARLPVERRAIQPTRSVAVEGGRVTLAPKNLHTEGPAPVPVTRAISPGQTRRDAKLPSGGEGPQGQPGNVPPSDSEARRLQDAAQQQQAEDSRKQVQAEDARKLQTEEDAHKQQADNARKLQAEDTLKQHQADNARKLQSENSLKQQQAEDGRKLQAENSRKQQAEDDRKQQQADNARKLQAENSLKQQQVEDAHKLQAESSLEQQQAEDSRKQQVQVARRQQPPANDQRNASEKADAETIVGTVTVYQAGRRIEILTSENMRHTTDLADKNVQVSVTGPVAVGAHVRLVKAKSGRGARVSISVEGR